MKGQWTCRRVTAGKKCGTANPNRRRKCVRCGKPRPARKRPAHMAVLTLHGYDQWTLWFGDRCNICGRPAGPRRNLDRDHDHRTGEPRGLLCHRCNRALPEWITAEWMRKALEYLARPRPDVQVEVKVIERS